MSALSVGLIRLIRSLEAWFKGRNGLLISSGPSFTGERITAP